jgi:hypothetical protein
MTWVGQKDSQGPSQRRSIFLAALTLVVTSGYLSLNFGPTPAGADGKAIPGDVSRVALVTRAMVKPANQLVVPLPPAAAIPLFETTSFGVTEADRIALLMNMTLLEQGRRRLAEASDYTCTFFKQERIDGELSDGQSIELKLRHKPFSVYMRWLSGDKGREVLYVDGVDENRMTVHPGGWKARFVPALKLDPEGSLAMRESRHSVSMVGLVKLCDEIVGRRKNELERRHPIRCRLIENETVNERACYCFVSIYLDRKISDEYRKSIQYIDKDSLLPVSVKNYAWPDSKQTFANDKALDEATLVEHYAYSELQFNQQLASEDFDRANKAYGFKR